MAFPRCSRGAASRLQLWNQTHHASSDAVECTKLSMSIGYQLFVDQVDHG